MPEKIEKIMAIDKNKFVPEDRETISSWQSRAIELAEQDDFRNHPITKKLVKIAEEEIERIDSILKNSEDLSELERKSLFREKKTHKLYVDLFTSDPSSELEAIDNKVNEIINQ